MSSLHNKDWIVICGFFFGLPVLTGMLQFCWDAHWCPLFTTEMCPWGCLPLLFLPAEFAVGSASQPGAEGVAVDVLPPGDGGPRKVGPKGPKGPLRGQCKGENDGNCNFRGGNWWKLPLQTKLLLTDSCRCHHYMVSSRWSYWEPRIIWSQNCDQTLTGDQASKWRM